MKTIKIVALMIGIFFYVYGMERWSIEIGREIVNLLDTLITTFFLVGGVAISLAIIFKDMLGKKKEEETE